MAGQILSSREERDFEAYIQALLTRGTDVQVLESLAELEVPPPFRVRVKVIYAPTSPAPVLDMLTERQLLQRLTHKSATYLYQTTVGHKAGGEIKVSFFLAPFAYERISAHVNAIIAVCKTAQWRALRNFIRHQYPDLVPILLSQSELIHGAKMLKRMTEHDVHVKEFSAKESLHGVSGKRRKSVREWTDEELDEALLNIQDRHQLLMSLDVDFFPKVGEHSHIRPRASCKIRKDGEIEVSGNFRLAFEAVATQVARVGEQKLRFFRGRGLRESQYNPQPLAINFPRPLFDDVRVVRNIVQLLSKYPHSMYAVSHGNPYAHVRLTDLFDGSSFDIWAIPPQRMALIPGLKASEAAFERVVHYIFEAFREGQITTYDREERTLEGAS